MPPPTLMPIPNPVDPMTEPTLAPAPAQTPNRRPEHREARDTKKANRVKTHIRPRPLLLIWRHSENGRWYQAHLGQDLLGDWLLSLSWGGIQRKGVTKRHPISDLKSAWKQIRILHKRRLQHGYRLSGIHRRDIP